MEKQNITEKMQLHINWYKQAEKQTLDSLPSFINHLFDYNHDYGTICHAVAAGGIATMWAMDNHDQGGMTGFQAKAVMWEFIKNWMYKNNEIGLKLMDYDHLLHPQYENEYEKIISQSTWELVQKKAKEKLDENDNITAHVSVRQHWQSIIEGKVPFGFQVKY